MMQWCLNVLSWNDTHVQNQYMRRHLHYLHIYYVLIALLAATIPGIMQLPQRSRAAGGITDAGLIGWEGDGRGPTTHMNGSFDIGNDKNFTVHFGIYDSGNYPLNWTNCEGYLPCDITEFERNNSIIKITNFGDKVLINGHDFVLVYSRVSVYNHGHDAVTLDPAPSPHALLALNAVSSTVHPDQTINHDYVIAVDKFNQSYSWPTDRLVVAQGGYDQHYLHMKNYWNKRLSALAQINQLPDQRMADAYKAGYIYSKIIEDDDASFSADSIHPGENGYDKYYDHDALGIVLYYIAIGDYLHAQSFLKTLHCACYADFNYKYAWPWAEYLMKTGDAEFVRQNFALIQNATHSIESSRTGPGKTMHSSNTIDALGNWTADDEAALLGLSSYLYITEKLGKSSELNWARYQYTDLLNSINTELNTTLQKNSLSSITCAVDVPNSRNRCSQPQDSNNLSFWAIAPWGWEGYLLNAPDQTGPLIDLIDATYHHNYNRLRGILAAHDIGGFPGFSEAYQVGAASEGLRGNGLYRPEAIRVYKFMIDENMDGPYSWWESNGVGITSSPWKGNHPSDGQGSAPHAWGIAQMNKALLDSFIAQRTDGTVLVGRGVPEEWMKRGQVIDISNYPILDNHRMGMHITMGNDGKTVTLTLSGDTPTNNVIFNLPGFRSNLASTTSGSMDNNEGAVTIPPSTATVTVTLNHQPDNRD
ncbi:hypothetical protein [Tengunoibacter tsumagoiensis]|uniref:Alpha-L-rhamnosidase six-hairpin glycosidase domain-containing protein n=1 Tax=Tengunoibacter tsumagoiensis TaxID=2014871 RepID=A0A401ZXP8_9CHLR|nr:hypothetical protein [Tengunoibacter tsumagoiensis]GCE11621.1 hypothetical protein KTT_14800 [Tengunoibacter tsumagoiensis]